jgi:hypothetical protein
VEEQRPKSAQLWVQQPSSRLQVGHMIVPATQLHQVFNAVRQDKHTSDDKAIVIFTANGDVDSLCSAYQLEVSSRKLVCGAEYEIGNRQVMGTQPPVL